MEGTITCGTLVPVYQIVWRYIQQGSISDGDDVENYWLKSKVLNTGHISLLDVICFLQSLTSYGKTVPITCEYKLLWIYAWQITKLPYFW